MKTKIPTIIIILLSLNCGLSNAQCHSNDWTFLKALYDSTDGDNWEEKTGWDTTIANRSAPPGDCNLESLPGISLNENGRIYKIRLGGNNLNGTIPKKLGSLFDLEHLDLHFNKLSGNIPLELVNLVKLTYLDLASNDFSGSIPLELANLNNLNELRLGSNNLTGTIPAEISNIKNLSWLQLGSNELSGQIPVEIGNLTNLYFLDLSSNQLSGNIPIELSQLLGLTTLSLKGNELSGKIPAELGNLDGLESLQLSYNELIGSLPAELSELKRLETLWLSNNSLEGCYPDKYVFFCSQLDHSFFDGNSVISNGNNFDAAWNDFCMNGVGACQEETVEVCHIDDWVALKSFYDSTNGDDWVSQTGWDVNIANHSSRPENCNLGNLIGVTLDEEGRVSTMRLVLHGLSGTLPAELGGLSNIQYLHLYSNQIGGSIPAELGNLSNLISLDLSTNKLTGGIPSELGNLKELINLILNDNNLEGCFPGNLANLCDPLLCCLNRIETFDASWRDFCSTGAGSCPPLAINSSEYENTFVSVHYDSVTRTLNVESNKSHISEVVLYNNMGQLVVNQPIDNEHSIKINLENLAFGLYVTVVNINGQLFLHKIFNSN